MSIECVQLSPSNPLTPNPLPPPQSTPPPSMVLLTTTSGVVGGGVSNHHQHHQLHHHHVSFSKSATTTTTMPTRQQSQQQQPASSSVPNAASTTTTGRPAFSNGIHNNNRRNHNHLDQHQQSSSETTGKPIPPPRHSSKLSYGKRSQPQSSSSASSSSTSSSSSSSSLSTSAVNKEQRSALMMAINPPVNTTNTSSTGDTDNVEQQQQQSQQQSQPVPVPVPPPSSSLSAQTTRETSHSTTAPASASCTSYTSSAQTSGCCTPPPCVRWQSSFDTLISDADGLALFEQFLREEQMGDMIKFYHACQALDSDEIMGVLFKLIGTIFKVFIIRKHNVVHLNLSPAVRKNLVKKYQTEIITLSKSQRTPTEADRDYYKAMLADAKQEIYNQLSDHFFISFFKSTIYIDYFNEQMNPAAVDSVEQPINYAERSNAENSPICNNNMVTTEEEQEEEEVVAVETDDLVSPPQTDIATSLTTATVAAKTSSSSTSSISSSLSNVAMLAPVVNNNNNKSLATSSTFISEPTTSTSGFASCNAYNSLPTLDEVAENELTDTSSNIDRLESSLRLYTIDEQIPLHSGGGAGIGCTGNSNSSNNANNPLSLLSQPPLMLTQQQRSIAARGWNSYYQAVKQYSPPNPYHVRYTTVVPPSARDSEIQSSSSEKAYSIVSFGKAHMAGIVESNSNNNGARRMQQLQAHRNLGGGVNVGAGTGGRSGQGGAPLIGGGGQMGGGNVPRGPSRGARGGGGAAAKNLGGMPCFPNPEQHHDEFARLLAEKLKKYLNDQEQDKKFKQTWRQVENDSTTLMTTNTNTMNNDVSSLSSKSNNANANVNANQQIAKQQKKHNNNDDFSRRLKVALKERQFEYSNENENDSQSILDQHIAQVFDVTPVNSSTPSNLINSVNAQQQQQQHQYTQMQHHQNHHSHSSHHQQRPQPPPPMSYNSAYNQMPSSPGMLASQVIGMNTVSSSRSASSSGHFSFPTTNHHNNESPITIPVTLRFSDEDCPYKLTLTGAKVTLYAFKQHIPKRNKPFKFYFKRKTTENEQREESSEYVMESIEDDSAVLPLCDGKIFALAHSIG